MQGNQWTYSGQHVLAASTPPASPRQRLAPQRWPTRRYSHALGLESSVFCPVPKGPYTSLREVSLNSSRVWVHPLR